MAKGFTYFAAAAVALILIKDGTASTLLQDAANFAKHGASGLRPLANVA